MDKNKAYQITGLDCMDCVVDLEKSIQKLEHVNHCEIQFASGKLIVNESADEKAIAKTVKSHGYRLQTNDVMNQQAHATPPNSFWQFMKYLWENPKSRLALIGVIFILPGLLLEEILQLEIQFVFISSMIAMLLAGFPVYRNALRSLMDIRNLSVNIDHLMSIASIGALAIGAYTEAGMVMVLFGIGEALEGFTGERSRDAIRNLLSSQPKMATKQIAEGNEITYQTVSVEELQVRDLILVKPAEVIPIDGVVYAGKSYVNQAAITGESKAIRKDQGSTLFAGSINGESALTVQVEKPYQDSTIAQMARLIEEAQTSQAPFERYINRFAARYTPAVIIASLLIIFVPTLVFGQPFLNQGEQTGWLYRGFAILVIACPCALVISTPVSMMSAMMRAFRDGIVIRGGRYLEALANVKAIAFDKTGTLTQGEPSVVQVRSLDCTCTRRQEGLSGQSVKEWCAECRSVIALASAVELQSEHPLARAIVDESVRSGVSMLVQPAEEVQAEVGQGVKGRIAGHWVFIGSHRGYHQRNQAQEIHCDEFREDVLQGYNPLLIAKDDQYLGSITVSDTIRESAAETVSELHQMGIEHIAILSGDDPLIAKNVGQAVHVDEAFGELFPADKVAKIRKMQEQFGLTIMAGDGINDGPALASADVGIAIAPRGKGTAQAMETADITILDDNLHKIPELINLGKRTMRMVKSNLWIAMGMKLFFLLMVIMGWGTMWMAVIADVGATLIVTLNGMRLSKPDKKMKMA
ncbi:MAG: cation-translocating P-type ATPase [Anaerolineaceae bacterium]|nr:cation-translocating P-type ATPase [Anaerolineaceae bacterium]